MPTPIIFDTLTTSNTPFAVLVSFVRVKGLFDDFHEEYTALGAVKDQNTLKNLGFRQTQQGHDLVLEYELTPLEKRHFQAMIERKEVRLVQRNQDGRVYEWAKCNDFAAYCGKVKAQKQKQ